MSKLVRGYGNLTAKIMLVGEAPGLTEERQGRPFVGGAGHVLDAMLREANIRRDMCYADNVVPARPPENKFKYFRGGKNESDAWIAGKELLKRTVATLKPNVVVALGVQPLYALTGEDKIGHWRGSIMWSEEFNVKVIPTYHPAAIMRNYEFRPLAVFDLTKAKRESEFPEVNLPPIETIVIRDEVQANQWEQRFIEEGRPTVFDIETNRNDTMLCCGFANSRDVGVVFPNEFIENVKRILESGIPLIAQNAQFDMAFMQHYYGCCPKNVVVDTMNAFHCIYSELPKSLAVLTSIYTDRPFFKDMAKEGDLYTYNSLDVVSTYEVWENIMPELEEFGTKDFYYSLPHKLLQPLINTHLRGVRCSRERQEEMFERLALKKAACQELLNRQFGEEVNVNSPKQMCDLLYNKLGLPKQVSRTTGNPTADEKTLIKLQDRYGMPELDLVMQHRHYGRLLSKDLSVGIRNGRVHSSYNIAGTVTGRLSSSSSIVLNSGTNLQNVPKEVRGMFLPDEGKVFVAADLEQAEARVVAYIADDPRLIKACESDDDFFHVIAEMVLGDRERRQDAKRLVHGSHYGMGVRTFRYYAGLPDERTARDRQNAYFNTFPNILVWQGNIRLELQANRVLTNLFGRKRMFFGRWDDTLFRSAYSYIPQGTVGDCLNYGLLKMDEWGYEIMLQVHDELVIQCLPEEVEQAKEDFKKALKVELHTDKHTFTIPVDFKVGNDWEFRGQ